MAEWLYEEGIGERRAALVENHKIIAAEVERDGDGVSVGSVLPARLIAHDRDHRRARVRLDDGAEAWLARPPAALTEGAALMVRITRMALREAGRDKPAQAMPTEPGEAAQSGPDLFARISATGHAVVRLRSADPADRLEAAGWSELTDAARTGVWPFDGGALVLSLTPAMLVIDVDGDLAPLALAAAGAVAVGAAIAALGLAGSIGIDFPTLAGRADRQRIDALLDAHVPPPFERTAMNGFGFVQIVRRRERPALIERMQLDPVRSDALGLLRRAGRALGTGVLTLTARPAVIDAIAAHADWTDRLAVQTGRAIMLSPDPANQGSGHAQ